MDHVYGMAIVVASQAVGIGWTPDPTLSRTDFSPDSHCQVQPTRLLLDQLVCWKWMEHKHEWPRQKRQAITLIRMRISADNPNIMIEPINVGL